MPEATPATLLNKGVVTTYAGGIGIQNSIDGVATEARFNYPTGVAVDASGAVYVADQGNNTIRRWGGLVKTDSELRQVTFQVEFKLVRRTVTERGVATVQVRWRSN